MIMRKGVLLEAGVVGGSLIAASYLIRGLVALAGRPIATYPSNTFLFAAGAATHIGWELTGGNRWFVERYPSTLLGSGR